MHHLSRRAANIDPVAKLQRGIEGVISYVNHTLEQSGPQLPHRHPGFGRQLFRGEFQLCRFHLNVKENLWKQDCVTFVRIQYSHLDRISHRRDASDFVKVAHVIVKVILQVNANLQTIFYGLLAFEELG
uniref:(northern house mosquito) hypothetical protein n=1 Tax=Culex pipiens TaxID=7175 RepID=A0A8D8A9L9_CULPI